MKLTKLFLLATIAVLLLGALPALAQSEEVDVIAHLDNYLQNDLPEGWGGVRPDGLSLELLESAPFLLDVREAAELEEVGYIPGAVHVPLREVASNLDMLPADLDAPIVVYCKGGHRGAIAMTALQVLGYTNVRNLLGGFVGWQGAEYEFTTDPISNPEPGTAAELDPALVEIVDAYLQDIPQGFGAVGVDAVFTETLESPPVLVDVRETAEWEEGYIEGAISSPLRGLIGNMDALPADLDTPIVIYCKSGHRGAIGMTVLQMAGYTNVRNMVGAYMAWLNAGYPVVGVPEAEEVAAEPVEVTLPEGTMLEAEALEAAIFDWLSALPQGFASAAAETLQPDLDNYFVLDVRELDEYESGHIEGAVNIPVRELAQNLHLLPDQSTPIMVYCAAGHRGALGTMGLGLLGYNDLTNLRGGIRAWTDAGFELVPESTPAVAQGEFPEVDPDTWTTVDTYLSNLPEGFNAISADNANLALLEGEEFVVVDVREVSEYEGGHLPGALNAPTREFGDFLSEIPTDGSILVVGSVGHRSALGMMALQMLGYGDVSNLANGFNAWSAAGYEVVTD